MTGPLTWLARRAGAAARVFLDELSRSDGGGSGGEVSCTACQAEQAPDPLTAAGHAAGPVTATRFGFGTAPGPVRGQRP